MDNDTEQTCGSCLHLPVCFVAKPLMGDAIETQTRLFRHMKKTLTSEDGKLPPTGHGQDGEVDIVLKAFYTIVAPRCMYHDTPTTLLSADKPVIEGGE